MPRTLTACEFPSTNLKTPHIASQRSRRCPKLAPETFLHTRGRGVRAAPVPAPRTLHNTASREPIRAQYRKARAIPALRAARRDRGCPKLVSQASRTLYRTPRAFPKHPVPSSVREGQSMLPQAPLHIPRHQEGPRVPEGVWHIRACWRRGSRAPSPLESQSETEQAQRRPCVTHRCCREVEGAHVVLLQVSQADSNPSKASRCVLSRFGSFALTAPKMPRAPMTLPHARRCQKTWNVPRTKTHSRRFP